jgi:WhiB family transcriptional regulator, redox-sensing transcriptional regulator
LRSSSDNWKLEGLCRTVDPDLWFPEDNCLGTAAIKVCRRCPVAEECLDYALENNERHGIWGGLSPNQRKLVKQGVKDKPEYEKAI